MSLVRTGSIKNLCISLEALSRINHPAANNMFEAVQDLLDTEITKARQEHNEEYKETKLNLDDDIPF